MRLPTLLLPIATVTAIALGPIPAPAGTAARPNIIVIISDDGGFADWEFMDEYIQTINPGQAGSPVPTPHLNTLRDRGVLFTNAYTASVCSPSRAAIVTGSYQQRIGYEYNINNLAEATAVDGLDPEVVTIFERMKAEGYTTGAIGKWHIGARAPDAGLGNRPENQGVDEFFGIWKGSRNYTVGGVTDTGTLRETIADPFSDTVLETTPPWNTTSNYVTNAFGQGAVAFIDRHYADPAPFFLYVAFTSPHGPIGPSPDINDPRIASLTGIRKEYASMVLTMDKEVGHILAKLDDPAGDGSVSLTDNTLVIYINDNGGASGIGTVNTPLSNWKGSTFEGGNRVPMLIAGPGVPSSPGTPVSYDAPVHSIDILPTCVEAAGGAPVPAIDGVNLIPFLDGSSPGVPHDLITIRSGSKVGVRKGDWKLTKNSTGSTFALYDLAADIGETTDLSGANPGVVEALLRDFTRFEAGCDKPRHAGLGDSPDSINLNDRFILNPRPSGGTSFVPDGLTLVGGATRNGDFNAGGGSGAQTFAQTPDWTNIGTGDQTQNATNTTLDTNGTRNAIIAETGARAFGLDTGHDLAAGERFRSTYEWLDASGWNDGSDRIRVSLFTTAGNTIAGTRTRIQSIDSGTSQADGLYQDEAAVFDPVPASAGGKRLFLEINAAQAGSGFARLDNFVLERGTVSGAGGTTTTLTWSEGNAWDDADTGSGDTLLTLDAFPGAVLEFPVTDTFSYIATNDMTRMSGLEFMLNRLRLTGTFTGTAPQSATIGGNALMFTNDLGGNAPAIEVAAQGAGFACGIATDLVLFDDLTITGDGDATVGITGTIRDYHEPRGITKSGSSTILLAGAHPYAGPTTISGGTLLLDTGAILRNTSVVVEAEGTLGGNGTVAGNISGPGTVSPGQSIGTLTTAGNAAPGTLAIEIDGAASDRLAVTGNLDLTAAHLSIIPLGEGAAGAAHVIATYGSLTGTFATTANLPAGYTIDYAYDDGGSTNNVALVSTPADPFMAWTTSSGLSGPAAAFDADPNNDKITNGLAFFLGAADALDDASSLLPAATVTDDRLDLTFLRSNAAAGLSYHVEYGDDLVGWSPAVDGTDGIAITIVDEGPHDSITVKLPAGLTDGPLLFARLAVAP